VLDTVQVVDDGAASEVSEVLARPTVASTTSLPATDMGERVFDRNLLSHLGSPLWCQLPCA